MSEKIFEKSCYRNTKKYIYKWRNIIRSNEDNEKMTIQLKSAKFPMGSLDMYWSRNEIWNIPLKFSK